MWICLVNELHLTLQIPVMYTAPAGLCVMLAFFVVCVTQSRHTQRLMTQVIVAVVIALMIAISYGFVDYVIKSVQFGK